MIGIGLVGGGFMGATHAAAYADMGDRAAVRSVFSRSADKAERVAATVGAEPATDLAAVLGDPSVDAVDICLPTDLHREVAEAAMRAGKHVFLEKPIALSLEDADAIARVAAETGRILMVGLVLRFWPEYVELGRRVAAGEIGTPTVVSTSRLSPPAGWNEWMTDVKRSGGVAVDLLAHDFDQVATLLGTPREVSAAADADGQHVMALVRCDGGVATVEGSMGMADSFPFSSHLRVRGTQGVAEYAFRVGTSDGEGNLGEADAAVPGLRLFPDGAEPLTADVTAADPFAAEVAAFVDCVIAGRQPEQATAAQARTALAVSLAANRSIESGRPEPV